MWLYPEVAELGQSPPQTHRLPSQQPRSRHARRSTAAHPAPGGLTDAARARSHSRSPLVHTGSLAHVLSRGWLAARALSTPAAAPHPFNEPIPQGKARQQPRFPPAHTTRIRAASCRLHEANQASEATPRVLSKSHWAPQRACKTSNTCETTVGCLRRRRALRQP